MTKKQAKWLYEFIRLSDETVADLLDIPPLVSSAIFQDRRADAELEGE